MPQCGLHQSACVRIVHAFKSASTPLTKTGPRGGGRWHGSRGGFALEGLTQGLNLTPDQQAKVQPMIEQARPQIIAIHQEAMDKTHAVMDKTISQIRPLLKPDQQKKLD